MKRPHHSSAYVVILRNALFSSPPQRAPSFFRECQPDRRSFHATLNASTGVRMIYNVNPRKRWPCIVSHSSPLAIGECHTPAQNLSDTPRTSSPHGEQATPK